VILQKVKFTVKTLEKAKKYQKYEPEAYEVQFRLSYLYITEASERCKPSIVNTKCIYTGLQRVEYYRHVPSC